MIDDDQTFSALSLSVMFTLSPQVYVRTSSLNHALLAARQLGVLISLMRALKVKENCVFSELPNPLDLKLCYLEESNLSTSGIYLIVFLVSG
jgi:hypothetical protein